MKKLIAVVLLIIFLFACGDTNEPADEVKSNDTETTEASIKPILPATRYDGKKFTIAYLYWALYNDNILAENETGDTTNDAVYKRQLAVEEETGIKLDMIDLGGISDTYIKVKASVMAGDDEYQLVLTHCVGSVVEMVMDKLICSWLEVPNVDLAKPYWKQNANKTFSIAGVQLYAVSDLIRSDPNALLFNKELITDYGLPNPYDLVNDGKWTWDKLIEISGVVSVDLNGDGIMDTNDRYGYAGNLGWEMGSIPYSCNQFIIEVKPEGPEFICNTEKMVSIIDKMYDLLYVGDRAYTWPYSRAFDPNVGGTPPVDFGGGHALFFQLPLTSIVNFRATEVDFGILPFPKYDEKQEKYLSLDWCGLMCVPVTANVEMVGHVTELLSYYSVIYTVPAYYDTLLTSKISRDNESQAMLNIIYDNLVYDYALNFYGNSSNVFYSIVNLLTAKSRDFTSYYVKNYEKDHKHYQDIYEAILDYNN
ncbi:MAG: extracellular solute-binding protein [Oscillospiraceae bacterium]|nr:extracellular solute-binding protein [Oscillospiraceae bacterium]